MGVGRVTGAAKRRRERRLRSMLRHERQTVAMELAAALHHSRDARSDVSHEAPRGQITACSGMRPAPPEEVSEPQVWAVTVGYVAAPVLLVSSPMLAGGDATDDVTVAFLVAAALEEKKDEEEKARVRRQSEAAEHEARMQELDRRVQDDVPLSPAESRAWMRWAGHLPFKKRKKRRMRKLPRNSSRPRLAAWHLGRYGPEGHFCRDTETASVARAVRTWKPGLSTSHWYLTVMDQKEFLAFLNPGSGMCEACIAGFYASLCVPFGCRQARGQVGLDQKNYYVLGWFYWCRCSSRCGPVLCRLAQDARHHCRYDSGEQVPRGVPEKRVFLEMTSYVSLFWSLVRQWIHIHVSLQRPGSELLKTAEFSQLQVIAGHRHSVRAAEADPHGPDYSAYHRDSTVAVRIWWSMSPLCGRAVSQVPMEPKTASPMAVWPRHQISSGHFVMMSN